MHPAGTHEDAGSQLFVNNHVPSYHPQSQWHDSHTGNGVELLVGSSVVVVVVVLVVVGSSVVVLVVDVLLVLLVGSSLVVLVVDVLLVDDELVELVVQSGHGQYTWAPASSSWHRIYLSGVSPHSATLGSHVAHHHSPSTHEH